jgi:hypothetical protein
MNAWHRYIPIRLPLSLKFRANAVGSFQFIDLWALQFDFFNLSGTAA